ncbi:MAG: hypothetical protein J6S67_23100 [Methanobrevibacter sp.]|nr:hypothetical protein [Methanobrevibacter sp.]
MDEELLNEIKSLRAELDELKDLVHKGIIEPIEKDYNDRKYKEATDIWTERYKDKLAPYVDKLKATEGDDFDLMKASYDAWNETDADSDEWVDALIKSIEESLEPLAKAFGVPTEELNATVEIENGEVTDVQADTEPEEGGEEVAEEEATEEEPAPEGEEELSEEEAFQRDLDEAYNKMKEKRY